MGYSDFCCTRFCHKAEAATNMNIAGVRRPPPWLADEVDVGPTSTTATPGSSQPWLKSKDSRSKDSPQHNDQASVDSEDLDRLLHGIESSPEVHVMLSRTPSLRVLGVKLTGISKNVVLVEKIGNRGLIKTWNEMHPPQQQVRPHDFIVSVNGECDAEAMLGQIKSKDTHALHIVIKHPN